MLSSLCPHFVTTLFCFSPHFVSTGSQICPNFAPHFIKTLSYLYLYVFSDMRREFLKYTKNLPRPPNIAKRHLEILKRTKNHRNAHRSVKIYPEFLKYVRGKFLKFRNSQYLLEILATFWNIFGTLHKSCTIFQKFLVVRLSFVLQYLTLLIFLIDGLRLILDSCTHWILINSSTRNNTQFSKNKICTSRTVYVQQ